MLVTRQQIRKIQTGLLRKLEQTECQTERKVLLGELEYFEAIGDSLKGLPLSAEQKLLLFTKEEYLVRRKRENDQEIYQSLGVSRRGVLFVEETFRFSENTAKFTTRETK